MNFETREIVGAASWASALINGDESGLDETEIVLLYAWLDHMVARDETIVAIANGVTGEAEEPWFSWRYAFHTGADVQGGHCLTYVARRSKREAA